MRILFRFFYGLVHLLHLRIFKSFVIFFLKITLVLILKLGFLLFFLWHLLLVLSKIDKLHLIFLLESKVLNDRILDVIRINLRGINLLRKLWHRWVIVPLLWRSFWSIEELLLSLWDWNNCVRVHLSWAFGHIIEGSLHLVGLVLKHFFLGCIGIELFPSSKVFLLAEIFFFGSSSAIWKVLLGAVRALLVRGVVADLLFLKIFKEFLVDLLFFLKLRDFVLQILESPF